jgi:hypothetical protein
LYSVFTYTADDVAIVLAVDGGTGSAEAWRFVFQGNKFVELSIHQPAPASQVPGVASDYWSRPRSVTPQPDQDYERFFVLPPRDALPSPPSGYDLTKRTGDTGVDRLLSIVAAREVQGLVAALATPDGTLFRGCGRYEQVQDSVGIAAWAATTLPTVLNLASVIDLPSGYHPAAEHLIAFRTQINPLLWGGFGLVERDGLIVAVFDIERGCQVEVMYPPPSYIVPPPPGGIAGLDPARRSGLPLVDAVLEAGYSGNIAAMDALISYGTPCGWEYAPECPAGVAQGTMVDALTSTACHGGYIKREDAPQAVIQLIQTSAIYGISGPSATNGTPNGTPNPTMVLLVSTNRERPNPVSLVFDSKGMNAIHRDCGGLVPDWALGSGTPHFLLPPP